MSRYGDYLFTCAWIVDGDLCGEDAEPWASVPVCDTHRDSYRSRINDMGGKQARTAANYYDLDEFPGWCYFALLPDGAVKIGYSNTRTLLDERYKALSRQYGATVHKMVEIPGGFVAEAVMHDRFKEYRLPGTGERFRVCPEIMDAVAQLKEKYDSVGLFE